jgi:hypothetical protein
MITKFYKAFDRASKALSDRAATVSQEEIFYGDMRIFIRRSFFLYFNFPAVFKAGKQCIVGRTMETDFAALRGFFIGRRWLFIF